MDLSSIVGSTTSGQEEKPVVEYKAQAASPFITGEVRLTVLENTLAATSPLDAIELAYREINALMLHDYTVRVSAESGEFLFSKLGTMCEAFYQELCDAYNKAVLRSLFVKGNPIKKTEGDYRYFEPTYNGSSKASILIFENSVVALPPDLGARRIPLCFISGIEKRDFEFTLKLSTSENYSFSRLGFETDVFEETIDQQLRLMRERSLEAIRELDPTLSAIQAMQIAKLMPRGVSAPFGQLGAIAPSFVSALESLLANSRISETYQIFKELCDPLQIYVGFKKGAGFTGNPDDETVSSDQYLLWLIAPSPDGRFAAVEFAESGSATFVYKTNGDYPRFALQLNRSLEAIDFKREVIRLSDEELRKPEYANYYMAAKRTAALQFVRSSFVGRVIHSSTESWMRRLTELWSV